MSMAGIENGMNDLEKTIELALSIADRIPVDKHKNLLGDKRRYIKEIANSLINEGYKKA